MTLQRRTRLETRSPLRRGKPLERGAPMKRTSGLKRGAPMARKAMRRSPRVQSPEEKAWRAFCRESACISCRKPGPCDPSHVTLSADQKGHGMLVPLTQMVPHCVTTLDGTGCHEQWEQRKGIFSKFSKDDRYAIAARWVAETREAVALAACERFAVEPIQ